MSVVSINNCINLLNKEINIIEKAIVEQKKDYDINTNYQLLLTITGIGKVIALDIILATNNFVKSMTGENMLHIADAHHIQTS